MARCGVHELRGCIGWGRTALVFATSDPSVVVRRTRSSEPQVVQAALAMAAEQYELQKVAGGMVEVVGFDVEEVTQGGRAWMAMARAQMSVGDFIRTGGGVDSGLLREWVNGVLEALHGLYVGTRRGHGNLTPNHVMLDGAGRVFLTEPSVRCGRASLGDDLYALGVMVVQLVKASMVVEITPPLEVRDFEQRVRAGDAELLGESIHGWREFTNRLLEKGYYKSRNGLDSVFADLREVEKLKPRVVRVAPAPVQYAERVSAPVATSVPQREEVKKEVGVRWGAIAAAVAVCGAGGAWWMQHGKPVPQPDVPQPSNPPPTVEVAEQVKISEDEKMGLGPKFANIYEKAVRQVKSGDGDIQSVMDGWSVIGDLKKKSEGWKARGWTKVGVDAAALCVFTALSDVTKARCEAVNAYATLASDTDKLWSLSQTKLDGLVAAVDWSPLLKKSEGAVGLQSLQILHDGLGEFSVGMEKLSTVKEGLAEVPESKKGLAQSALVFPAKLPESATEWQSLADDWGTKLADFKRPSAGELAGWKAQLKTFREVANQQSDKVLWLGKVAAAEGMLPELTNGGKAAFAEQLKEFAGLKDMLLDSLTVLHSAYVLALKKFKTDAAVAAPEQLASLVGGFKAERAKTMAALVALEKMGNRGEDFRQALGGGELESFEKTLAAPEVLKLFKDDHPLWSLPKEGDKGDKEWANYYFGSTKIRFPFRKLPNSNRAVSVFEVAIGMLTPLPTPGIGPRYNADGSWLDSETIRRLPGDIKSSIPVAYEKLVKTSASFPVTWIQGSEAEKAANGMGCELPTLDDWKAVYGRQVGPVRLRGKQWAEWAGKMLSGLKGNGTEFQKPNPFQYPTAIFPDYNSFKPTPWGQTSTVTVDARGTGDGGIWLADYRTGGSDGKPLGFYHVVGNAAEWVKVGNTYKVFGGSVVSNTTQAEEGGGVSPLGSAFQDVGFRLAVNVVSAASTETVEGVKKAIADLPEPAPPK